MKRSAKIIQISGFRGIIIAVFVVTCLIAGFVVFPGYVAMHLWNSFATSLPALNLIQGILLWAILALICFIANKQGFSISFASPKELNEEEMNVLLERIKTQTQAKIINQMMMKDLKNLDEKINKQETEIDKIEEQEK